MKCECCGQEVPVKKFTFLAQARTKSTYPSRHVGYVIRKYKQPEKVHNPRWMIDLFEPDENMVIWYFEDDLEVVEELVYGYRSEWASISKEY